MIWISFILRILLRSQIFQHWQLLLQILWRDSICQIHIGWVVVNCLESALRIVSLTQELHLAEDLEHGTDTQHRYVFGFKVEILAAESAHVGKIGIRILVSM